MKCPVLKLFLWLTVTACIEGYEPRGWRPQGQSFDPSSNHLNTYDPPSRPLIYGFRNYLPTKQPALGTTTPTSTTTTANTTPKSREPTTVSGTNDQDDFDSNPALAIANSFAFNRPVYILNTFPFHPSYIPGYTFIK